MIEIVKKIAREAGEITLEIREKGLLASRKTEDASNIVTQGDKASEDLILKAIKKNFPDHSVLSEESGANDIKSENCWVIDPIDGTIPYSVGLPTFGVSVGLLKKGRPYLGVISLPALGELYWAEMGKGAFLNNKKISVSKKGKIKEALVGFELGWMENRKNVLRHLIEPVALNAQYTPIFGCTVAGLCYVARGALDGYIHTAYPWDFAAGAVIIEEAGGKISDQQGRPIDWSKNWMDVLVSNGRLHKQVLKLINP